MPQVGHNCSKLVDMLCNYVPDFFLLVASLRVIFFGCLYCLFVFLFCFKFIRASTCLLPLHSSDLLSFFGG